MKNLKIENFDYEGAVVRLENNCSHRLIIANDKLLLLKSSGDVLRYNPELGISESPYFEQKLGYDVSYLDLSSSFLGNLFRNFLLKNIDGNVVLFERKLGTDIYINSSVEMELTREETEDYFDSNNYDAMYLINKKFGVLFAANKQDGIIINKRVVPTDDEIIELEKRRREMDLILYNIFDDALSRSSYISNALPNKTIDEIKDLGIYYSLSSDYSDLLITLKKGKLSVNWFTLDFLEKDRFKLVTLEEKLLDSTVELSNGKTSSKRLFKSIFGK